MEWAGLVVPQLDGFTGFVPPAGDGTYKVALAGEAPGEMEARFSQPFYEKAPAGSVLKRLLSRAGLERDKFTIWNTVWSRPPNNYLENARYEGEAIAAFAPFREKAFEMYRPKVIVALGGVALRAFSHYGGKGATISNVQGYVLDGPWDGTYVIGALHPSAIMRGEQRMSGCVIWALQRAIDIARNGFVRLPTNYITHPSLDDALAFERGYNPDRHILSYDIETLESSSLDEEEVEEKDEEISFTITRISLCYEAQEGRAVSLPWQQPYIDIAKRLVGSRGPKRVWNGNFDNPRLAAAGSPVGGRIYDSMWAWKFLQPTLPRSLGFVAPFYNWTGEPWKHTSSAEPERYSCQDAHALQMIGDGVDAHLKQKGQWHVYERHVVEVSEVLDRMSKNGLPYDQQKAQAFQQELQEKWDERFASLQARVPEVLKPSKQKFGYKKGPKDTTGLVQREFNDLDEQMNVVKVTRWCKLEPFLPTSWQQLLALIKHYGHKAGTNRKTKKETTEDDTLKKLVRKCRASRKPRDQEFAQILQMCRECRKLSKVNGIVKSWQPKADGRVHAQPGFWGEMFRISWRRPAISATIQDKENKQDDLELVIGQGFRKCVTAPVGKLLLEADWKSMEAILTAYFAGDKDYDRLARLGVHDYMTCHILADRGKMSTSALPDLTWSDSDLKQLFKQVKHDFPADRDDAKHCIHGISYGMTAFLMAEQYEMQKKTAQRLIDLFFTLFPKIKAWQKATRDRASRECKLRNPFNYEMQFYEVYRWDSKKQDWTLGQDAKSCIAFMPRDTGAGMLKEVLLRLRYLADDGLMLASTHDSITCEVAEADLYRVARILQEEMQRGVPELGGLVIPVELKAGISWHESQMQTLELTDASLASLPCAIDLSSSAATQPA